MKKLLLITITFLSFNIANAQWSMGFGMAGTCPLMNFDNKGYHDGLGYSLSILSRPFPKYYNWQLQMGGNLNHFWAGNEKTDITLVEPANALATYKIRNTNTAISFKTRLISRPNPIRYHIDLDLGYRGFTGRESIVLHEADTNYTSRYDSTLVSSGNFFAGLTAGVMFRISESFYLDLYSRIDYGFNSNWYDLNSFTVSNDIPQYNSYVYNRTHTPLLWVGLTASFNINKKERSTGTRPSSTSTGGSSTPPRNNPKPTKEEKPKSDPKPKPKPIKPKTNPTPPPGPR